MASDMTDRNHLSVVLGDEYDDALRARLIAVLQHLGAIPAGPSTRTIAGSQDFEEMDILLDGHPMRIEAETYVGLTLSGSAELVERVRSRL